MKRLSFLRNAVLVVLFLSFSGCHDSTLTTGDGSNVVKASGKVATEEREISAFDQIVLEGIFNVYLLQKEKESIRIQADEQVLPFITTEVLNNVLTVKLKDDSKYVKMGKITVYITLRDISKLETKGVGLLHCMDTLKLGTVELNFKGVGATSLNLNCDQLNVRSEMVGTLTLAGSAKGLTIKHKGIGAFKAFDFKAETVNMESDGVGKAEIFASKQLTIDAKGLGGVVYKGDPAAKNITNEGVGVVASAQ